MKKRHYIITAVVSYLLILLITVPAKPFTDIINDNASVSIQGVSGTLWSGKAYLISIDNIQLRNTEWSFNLLKLFIGRLAINLDSQHSGNKISAEVGTSFLGRFFLNNLTAKISAAELSQIVQIPLAQLDGMISLNIEHAQWKQGELPLATGEINWKNASITVADTASLGNVSILLTENEEQLLNAEIKNQGGDIKINGTAELIPDTDYAVNIKLKPTATANNNIKQSLGLFSKKQPDGNFLFKKTGSLNQVM